MLHLVLGIGISLRGKIDGISLRSWGLGVPLGDGRQRRSWLLRWCWFRWRAALWMVRGWLCPCEKLG